MVIRDIEVKDIMTRTNLPVSDFAVNPYVGCTHACKYCYASFMKRFTDHPEPWGEFVDVKSWPKIDKPGRYAGKEGMLYIRDDDQHRAPFGEPPVVCNYFYHEEITKSAKKKK